MNLDVCRDQFKLYEHGENARTMCNTAAAQNQASPRRCAWRRFWKEGEVYGVYKRVAHSQWMLYGLLMPALLFTIYMIFATYRSGKEGARQEREQHAMLEAMKDVAKSMSGSQQQLVPYQARSMSARALLPQQPVVMLPSSRSYPLIQEIPANEYEEAVPVRRRRLRARRKQGRKGPPNASQMVTVY